MWDSSLPSSTALGPPAGTSPGEPRLDQGSRGVCRGIKQGEVDLEELRKV